MTLDVIAANTGYISQAGSDSKNPLVSTILMATLGSGDHGFASKVASAGQSFAAKQVNDVSAPSNGRGGI